MIIRQIFTPITLMKTPLRFLAISLMAVMLAGCGGKEFHEPWRAQKLPSGKEIKVMSLQIAWGIEHDEPRREDRDCFVLQYVYPSPKANDLEHEQEAKEVFELIRSVSEQWGFTNAELMAYPALERDRHYDLFLFQRGSDGKWAVKLERH